MRRLSGGPCFARQVRKCRGACVGEESPEQHNLRLVTALAPYRVADWPFAGRAVIRERHDDGRIEEAHVFDRWCHLGTARDEDGLLGLLEGRCEIGFDPDVYSIVKSFIAKKPSRVSVVGANRGTPMVANAAPMVANEYESWGA